MKEGQVFTNMREFQEIDQPLYSRMMVGGEKNEFGFFGTNIGLFDKQGEMITNTDTNMQNPGMIQNLFAVRGIRFRETEMDGKTRRHMLKYGHFVFRITDRDYLTYPLHLMENYYYFLEKKLETQIIIKPYDYFCVSLRMKSYETQFQLTCELLGIMRRSG